MLFLMRFIYIGWILDDRHCPVHESVIDRGQPRILKACSALLLSSPCVDLTLSAFNPADFKDKNCLT